MSVMHGCLVDVPTRSYVKISIVEFDELKAKVPTLFFLVISCTVVP